MKKNSFILKILSSFALLTLFTSCDILGGFVDKQVSYTVHHYLEEADTEAFIEDQSLRIEMTGTVGEKTQAQALSFTGFTVNTFEQKILQKDNANDISIYYKRNIVSISFDLNGGSGETSISGKYGSKVYLPVEPVKDNYVFTGWNTELPERFPVNNLTVIAQWKELKAPVYTITFDGKGGTGEMDSLQVEYDQIVTLPKNTFVRDGYIFDKWARFDPSRNCEVLYSEGDSYWHRLKNDVTFYAKWKSTTAAIDVTIVTSKDLSVVLSSTTDGKLVTFMAEGFENRSKANYSWYLDSELQEKEKTKTLIIDTAKMSGGKYEVMVVVELYGDFYSARAIMEFTN